MTTAADVEALTVLAMTLRAVPPPTPIATPAPPPAAAENAAATPTAESEEASVARIESDCAVETMSSFELSAWARTVLVTRFSTPIPAPAPLTPTAPPPASDTAAAQAVVAIVERLSAAIEIPPDVAFTP